MEADILKIDGIHTYYGQSHILRGLTFAVPRGRVLGLLGRNGAGKSTCISTIMGLLKPTAGSIKLDKLEIAGGTPEMISRLGLALVPQGRRIFKSLTVYENLAVAERSRGGPWTVDAIYRLFPRLAERRKQFAGKLSGGEQQMLAVSRALMGNPKVLLLDEPTEGLAPLIVREIARIVRALKEMGLTIVLVEQNISMALDVVDDVAVISNGEIVHLSSASELRSRSDLISKYLGVSNAHSTAA